MHKTQHTSFVETVGTSIPTVKNQHRGWATFDPRAEQIRMGVGWGNPRQTPTLAHAATSVERCVVREPSKPTAEILKRKLAVSILPLPSNPYVSTEVFSTGLTVMCPASVFHGYFNRHMIIPTHPKWKSMQLVERLKLRYELSADKTAMHRELKNGRSSLDSTKARTKERRKKRLVLSNGLDTSA